MHLQMCFLGFYLSLSKMSLLISQMGPMHIAQFLLHYIPCKNLLLFNP
uniref:Uncharacterized protein n=1 Tax=Rhizophora mucronata TaxID=61149 RepID=A0A2P2P970_RHIMU